MTGVSRCSYHHLGQRGFSDREDSAVQVALDYYRVLMISEQVDKQQIEQAYRERSQDESSVWPGFSVQALQAKRQLLEEAREVLIDPFQRKAYDSRLPHQHTLDLDPPLLPGALLILCESGDFAAAQELAQILIEQKHPALTDAILTLAITHLELGRAAWQKGSYEKAAEHLKTALVDLEAQRAFPELQSEIATDLGKLRPYRILSLLTMGDDSASERDQGLTLLKSMLSDRRGIEGHGQDSSGLTTEDFLRFIQRVRRQLTAVEQEELFKEESERPSPVACYLLAQVLMTRGFVENRPALVRTARSYLTRLAQQQDVHLEQAMSALLLGQTEEALEHLQFSQEQDPITYIEKHSDASPDRLPGLCRYTEKWFQEEVFPEFRHLNSAHLSLDAYFGNEQVQAYLEEMPDLPPEQEVTIDFNAPKRSVSVPSFARHPRSEFSPSEYVRPSEPELDQIPNDHPPRIADLPLPEEDPEATTSGYRPPRVGRRRAPRAEAPALLTPLLIFGGLGIVGGIIVVAVNSILNPSQRTEDPPPSPAPTPPIQLSPSPIVSPIPTAPPTPPVPPEWVGVEFIRVTSGNGIRMRQEATTESNIIQTVPNNAVLKVIDIQSNPGSAIPIWLQVERNGVTGWVAAESGGARLVERSQ